MVISQWILFMFIFISFLHFHFHSRCHLYVCVYVDFFFDNSDLISFGITELGLNMSRNSNLSYHIIHTPLGWGFENRIMISLQLTFFCWPKESIETFPYCEI